MQSRTIDDGATEPSAAEPTGTTEQARPPRPADDRLWEAPIVMAATPIGNLGDATSRLKDLLTSAEVIACEDTRRTRHLIQALGLSTQASLVSMHEHNEASRAADLVQRAAGGARILVVTDAGMPAVSDPGFRLISAAVQAGVAITAAPGASAVTTALALSGLSTDRFTFGGFLPRKRSDRTRLIQRLKTEDWTTVLFESPYRISATVSELADQLGAERGVAVARELTKRFEEVLRGSLGDVAELLAERQQAGTLKGEFVLVIAGTSGAGDHGDPGLGFDQAAQQVVDRAAAGERIKAAAKELAAEHGFSARELYDAAVALRRIQHPQGE